MKICRMFKNGLIGIFFYRKRIIEIMKREVLMMFFYNKEDIQIKNNKKRMYE